MAYTKEQRAAKALLKFEPLPEMQQTELVTMIKGKESIEVHPTCVANHRRLGWVVA